ncbi:hypothetical protein VWN85_10040, partial [Campylobacter coli]
TMKIKDFEFRVWEKDEKCCLDAYIKSRAVLKNLPNEKLLNLDGEFLKRFEAYLNGNAYAKERLILKAASYFATRWEFNIVYQT